MPIQELIKDSSEYMIRSGREDVGNCPMYPTLVIFCGGKTQAYYEELKKNLDRNWGRYANKIPYLSISADGGDALQATDLRTKESGDAADMCQQLINGMLALEPIFFPNRTRIKVECIISSEDDWDAYRELLQRIGRNQGMALLKTLYLMAEQENEEHKAKTREFIQKLGAEEEQGTLGFEVVYFLSNYLSGNRLLLDQNMSENYRLVSGLILLGGNCQTANRHSGGQFTSAMYGGTTFKTAAYAVKQKPVKEIVLHGLEYLLERMQGSRAATYRRWDEVQKAIGIAGGQIRAFEEFYNQLRKNLPGPEVMQGFALKKEGKPNGTVPDFEKRSYGASRLFYEKYFLQEGVLRWLNANARQAAQSIVDQWCRLLNYSEIKAYFRSEEMRDCLAAANVRMVQSGGGKGPEYQVYNSYVTETKKVFCEEMAKLLREELELRHQVLLQFEEMFDRLADDLADADYTEAQQKKSICQCYNDDIDSFIAENQEKMMQELLNPTLDQQSFLQCLSGWFRRLVDSRRVYHLSFEEELLARMKGAGDENLQSVLNNELQADLTQSRRMHLYREPCAERVLYLINEDADYAKYLRDQDGTVLIFDLNRTDCVEKIAVCDIRAIADINFMEG